MSSPSVTCCAVLCKGGRHTAQWMCCSTFMQSCVACDCFQVLRHPFDVFGEHPPGQQHKGRQAGPPCGCFHSTQQRHTVRLCNAVPQRAQLSQCRACQSMGEPSDLLVCSVIHHSPSKAWIPQAVARTYAITCTAHLCSLIHHSHMKGCVPQAVASHPCQCCAHHAGVLENLLDGLLLALLLLLQQAAQLRADRTAFRIVLQSQGPCCVSRLRSL